VALINFNFLQLLGSQARERERRKKWKGESNGKGERRWEDWERQFENGLKYAETV
jgi:hypothetical protein